jgi:hypothetical protein
MTGNTIYICSDSQAALLAFVHSVIKAGGSVLNSLKGLFWVPGNWNWK